MTYIIESVDANGKYETLWKSKDFDYEYADRKFRELCKTTKNKVYFETLENFEIIAIRKRVLQLI